ncbi:hypothetical protein G7K_2230-t1 [Saitoella complicata NRRL Y-17804]|uniref:Uncharacterized protein n=1 Tax=Saitoella complicata (strain BCRC 22490 / CBS 7301 / JCM 7358 / NBRC 10748 / NRRL Y-17804) TaxID=698492 RepID=A0A0E9NDW1_SAICN|nr:hypothetical protein G7K_2230-t1 [Saitoella complicata NRRL Y-17804]
MPSTAQTALACVTTRLAQKKLVMDADIVAVPKPLTTLTPPIRRARSRTFSASLNASTTLHFDLVSGDGLGPPTLKLSHDYIFPRATVRSADLLRIQPSVSTTLQLQEMSTLPTYPADYRVSLENLHQLFRPTLAEACTHPTFQL